MSFCIKQGHLTFTFPKKINPFSHFIKRNMTAYAEIEHHINKDFSQEI